MASAEPTNILVILFLAILIPVAVIYWIVGLAESHELNRRKASSL
jgi:hypothetical protein